MLGRRDHAAPRRRAWPELAFFAAGLAFLGAILARVGTAPIAGAFAKLGWALVLVTGAEVFAVVANAISWRYAILPERRREVPVLKLLGARIAGDALNYLLPGGILAGEVPRARLLRPELPIETAIASVTIAKLTEAVSLAGFGALGALAALPALASGTAAAAAVAGAVTGGICLALGFFAIVRRGLYATVLRIARRLGAGSAGVERLAAAAGRVDAEIARFCALHARSLALSTFWHLTGWLVNVAELWLAFHFLGLRAPLYAIFAIEALSAAWDGVFFFIPAKAGSEEGGRIAVLALFGFGAAQGLAIGMVRRVRELVFAAVGLVLYAALSNKAGPAPARAPAPAGA